MVHCQFFKLVQPCLEELTWIEFAMLACAISRQRLTACRNAPIYKRAHVSLSNSHRMQSGSDCILAQAASDAAHFCLVSVACKTANGNGITKTGFFKSKRHCSRRTLNLSRPFAAMTVHPGLGRRSKNYSVTFVVCRGESESPKRTAKCARLQIDSHQ